MLLVPLVWIVLFVILLGCGAVVVESWVRLGGRSFRHPLSAFQTMWLGFALVLALLQVQHLFAPIGRGSLILVPGLAALGLFLARGAIARRLLRLRRRPRTTLATALAMLAMTAPFVRAAALPITLRDTGLYHQ